jgi:hypothetical protein
MRAEDDARRADRGSAAWDPRARARSLATRAPFPVPVPTAFLFPWTASVRRRSYGRIWRTRARRTGASSISTVVGTWYSARTANPSTGA